MKNSKGSTFIELMIAMAIISILSGVAYLGYKNRDNYHNQQYCYQGYVILPNGNQLFDENGHAIRCVDQ